MPRPTARVLPHPYSRNRESARIRQRPPLRRSHRNWRRHSCVAEFTILLNRPPTHHLLCGEPPSELATHECMHKCPASPRKIFSRPELREIVAEIFQLEGFLVVNT
jgi:hypothetical protein